MVLTEIMYGTPIDVFCVGMYYVGSLDGEFCSFLHSC